jgi:hypothetical protein
LAVGHKRRGGPGEGSGVTRRRRNTQFVDPAAEREIGRAYVVLLSAQHDERIVGLGRRAAISIAGVTGSAMRSRLQGAIHKELQHTIHGATSSDMMPLAVGDALTATNRGSGSANAHAKDDTPIAQRDAQIAIVAAAIYIAVKDDIAIDPAILFVASCHAAILARQRPHPELDREIRGPDIDRARRRINRNKHAITAGRGKAIAVQPQRVPAALGQGRRR